MTQSQKLTKYLRLNIPLACDQGYNLVMNTSFYSQNRDRPTFFQSVQELVAYVLDLLQTYYRDYEIPDWYYNGYGAENVELVRRDDPYDFFYIHILPQGGV